MLKRFTKTKTRCPVVVYEEINAVFWKEKDPKMTKKTKNFQIFKVLSSFCQIFDRICGKRSTWYKVCCPVGVSEEIMAVFLLKKVSN